MADVFKKKSRVLFVLDPEVWVQFTEERGAFRAPGPVKVLRNVIEDSKRIWKIFDLRGTRAKRPFDLGLNCLLH